MGLGVIFKYTCTALTDQIESISLQGEDGDFVFDHPEVHLGIQQVLRL